MGFFDKINNTMIVNASKDLCNRTDCNMNPQIFDELMQLWVMQTMVQCLRFCWCDPFRKGEQNFITISKHKKCYSTRHLLKSFYLGNGLIYHLINCCKYKVESIFCTSNLTFTLMDLNFHILGVPEINKLCHILCWHLYSLC